MHHVALFVHRGTISLFEYPNTECLYSYYSMVEIGTSKGMHGWLWGFRYNGDDYPIKINHCYCVGYYMFSFDAGQWKQQYGRLL